jgi:hypothetical protein
MKRGLCQLTRWKCFIFEIMCKRKWFSFLTHFLNQLKAPKGAAFAEI